MQFMKKGAYMTQVRIEGDLYMKIKAYVETHPNKKNITNFITEILKEKINQLYREHLIETLGEQEVQKVLSQQVEFFDVVKKFDKALTRIGKEQQKLRKELHTHPAYKPKKK